MWNIKEIKASGRSKIRINYWRTFLFSTLLFVIASGTTLSAIFGYVDEIPDLISDVMNNEVMYKSKIDLQVIAVLVLLSCSMLLLVTFMKACIAIFIKNPIQIGSGRFLIRTCTAENESDPHKGQVADIGWCFDQNYINGIKTLFFRDLSYLLWGLLLIIPGLIKTYEYRFVHYLMAEDPSMPVKDALKTSKEMMKGHKWRAFIMDLSFIPWHILGIITLGFAEVFYVRLYINLTDCELYLKLKELYLNGEVEE